MDANDGGISRRGALAVLCGATTSLAGCADTLDSDDSSADPSRTEPTENGNGTDGSENVEPPEPVIELDEVAEVRASQEADIGFEVSGEAGNYVVYL